MLKNKALYNLEREIDWLEAKTTYRRLQKIGIHDGQPAILAYIYMHKGCNQYAIAKYLGVSRATIGLSIKRMEKSGLVEVVASETDTRAKQLKVTKRGIKSLVASDMVLDDYISKKYDAFDEEEIHTYIAMLERIKANLTKLYHEE